MNINQLESFSLAESAKFKDHLNPTLWDRHENLRNAVRDQILVGAEEYCSYLGLSEEQVVDIVVTGSNAGYLYESKSGIDVVVIAELNQDETFREFFNEHKYKYNGQHRVEVDGHLVQFYVQPAEQNLVTSGSYSLIRESWVQIPVRRTLKEDTVKRLKAQDLAARPQAPRVVEKKVVKERKPVVYGFGQDYLAEVGLTPDGVSASTCQFANETTHEHVLTDREIIQDFVEFCSNALELEHDVRLKLKHDPQWSIRNQTFGRYNNEHGTLEVAVGQRHIMDVLRTIAHELTHQRQHETVVMPPDAGDDGSDFENEANASAGVLMRQYGKKHPELFSHADLKEDAQNPWINIGFDLRSDILWPAKMFESADPDKFIEWVNNYKTGLTTPKKHSKCILAMPTQISTHKITIFYGSAIFEGETEEMYLLTIDSGTHKYSKNNQMLFASEGDFNKFELMLKLKFSDYDIGIENMVVRESTLHESSGYIPTAAEAHDPRFEMALSVDIHPGALGKAANAFLLNTDSQGHPQLLRTDGVVDRLYEEYRKFKA